MEKIVYVVTTDPQLLQSDAYKVISVEESLQILETFGVLQFDSETTGLDPHINKLLCLQFGNKTNNTYIVVDAITIDVRIYKDLLESKYLIMQNGKFDLQFLFTLGITPNKVYDTMIVEQLLHLGYPPKGVGGMGYGLGDIAQRYLGLNLDKSIRSDIARRGLDAQVIEYAVNDVVYLEDIMWKQWHKCKLKKCTVGAKLECDFVPVMAYLEWCGIKLDITKWKAKMKQNQHDLDLRLQALNAYAVSWEDPRFYKVETQGDLFSGFCEAPICTINWLSAKQVVTVVQSRGFTTKIKDKKTGEYKDSVEESNLRPQKGIDDTFLKLYFAYQESAKECSTYGQTYIDAINPNTGRIHTVFRQLGAASGRMTCGSQSSNTALAELNGVRPEDCVYVQLQTLPGEHATRSSFVAGEGRLFCSADFSALESRLGADIYNEQSMLEEYREGSGDIHSLVAKACFKEELSEVPVKEVKHVRPDLRKRAKPIGFSQQFGGSAYAIAGSLMCTIEEAGAIAKAYNDGFPGIATFKSKGSRFVRRNGYIVMNPDTGHRLHWHDWDVWNARQQTYTSEFWQEYRILKKENPFHPTVKEVSTHSKAASKYDRLALNSVTQATGAIILKESCISFYKYILDNNLHNIVKINNLVHDEINIDYPDTMSEIPNILKKCMEDAANKYCYKLPIPAEVSVGDYWIH